MGNTYGSVSCQIDREDRRVGLHLRDASRQHGTAMLALGTAATLAATIDAAARDSRCPDVTFDGSADGEITITVDRDGPRLGIYLANAAGEGFECTLRADDAPTVSAALWAAVKDDEAPDMSFTLGGSLVGYKPRGGDRGRA